MAANEPILRIKLSIVEDKYAFKEVLAVDSELGVNVSVL